MSTIIFVVFTAVVLPMQSELAASTSGDAGSPDTSLFYSADDLYEMAETYGEVGRSAYIRARFTFDIVWPLVYTLFLATTISWSFRKAFAPSSWLRKLNLAPLITALFDYLENITAALVLYRYPLQTPVVDSLAGIFTLLKWTFISASFIFVVGRPRDGGVELDPGQGGRAMTMTGYQWNGRVQGLSCMRCGKSYSPNDAVADLGIGCPACLEQGYPVSLRVDNDPERGWRPRQSATGMMRYAERLPYLTFPTLGEGATALVELPTLAQSMGIERLWVKNEGQNPTGSHKDRMSALAVARAASLGRKTVVAASSGNAGASLAAYAGAANLRCVIISTAKISPTWERAIRMAGAELILTDTAKERWQLMRHKVEAEGWYPVTNYLDPPTGSNPFGVQGYKTVAYEIVEQCAGEMPTVVIVPTARGDLLWGIWQGFLESGHNELPRLVAVEPFARLSRVLAGEDYRQSFAGGPHAMSSIGGATATYQSLVALRESRGMAVEVSDIETERAQHTLARLGFYTERSSAAALAGLQTMVENGRVGNSDRVVLVVTSHGYKEMKGVIA